MTVSTGDSGREPSVFWIVLLRVFAVVVGLFGLIYLIGGGWLAALGGSLYYVVAGALFLASGVLLFRRNRIGAWLYGLALALTVIWAIWEVGFDGWQLLPRLLIPAAFGVWLLLPFSQWPLHGRFAQAGRVPFGATGLLAGGTVVSVALGAALFALLGNVPPDPRFQTGFGPFPERAAFAYEGVTGDDWPTFGGDPAGTRFSPLDQITPGNVMQLQVAWQADVGVIPATNATPLKIGETIYTCNNINHVFALSATTGEQLWFFDNSHGYGGSCRGVAYYEVEGEDGLCANRIIAGSAAARLVALDAETGLLCPDFGTDGVIDLTVGMGDFEGNYIPGYYRVTSAPTLARGNIVVGGWITDGQYWGEPSGVIRAYDVVTGEFAWAWDAGNPGVHTEPAEGENYTAATPNSWGVMSADDALGLVYLPTGNATPDYFGEQRRAFDDQFNSSVIALNAETGELVWSFQTVHHDVWDYDTTAQPTLIDLPGEGGAVIPALIQGTKQGEVYVLNRVTGEPIFEVTETPVPQTGGVPEERLSPTQPFSNQLPSFRGADLREADMWGISPFDQLYCRIMFREARYEGIYTPPGVTPSVQFPASFGAINWGGVSVHPGHGVMVVNAMRFATYINLIPREEADAMGLTIQGEYASARETEGAVAQLGTPYAANPQFWLTALDVPCIAPPYGTISAVDLNTGRLLWSDRFGTAKGSGALGLKFPFPIPMGTPTHGGSMITDTGIVFIGQTADSFFHAYDLRTGNLLWRYELPGGGSSTPISYTIDGKQYVVVMAAGQGAIQSPFNTKMVAFALPD